MIGFACSYLPEEKLFETYTVKSKLTHSATMLSNNNKTVLNYEASNAE